MLSNTADYALRAVIVLAAPPRESRATDLRERAALRADEIAEAIGAPRNYVAKTLNALVKAGIVSSARGPGGGFTLAESPRTLTVARIVDLFDRPRRTSMCLLGAAPCDPASPCTAHPRWSQITAARREPLTTTTIADLLPASRTPTTVA